MAHSDSDESTQYMATQPDDPVDLSMGSENSNLNPISRPQFSRRSSTRYGSSVDTPFPNDSSDTGTKLRPQMSRRGSTRLPSHVESFRRERVVTFRDSVDSDDDGGSEDDQNLESRRALSAREAVAAQEAAEAAAAAEDEHAEDSEAAPVSMSLIDLLEETDRQMGFEGSRYRMTDDEDEEENEGEGEDEDGEGGAEYNCCVCMVRHKGAAFIPCGHTYCRMCSRELSVSKPNCPLCNNFILEILNIF